MCVCADGHRLMVAAAAALVPLADSGGAGAGAGAGCKLAAAVGWCSIS